MKRTKNLLVAGAATALLAALGGAAPAWADSAEAAGQKAAGTSSPAAKYYFTTFRQAQSYWEPNIYTHAGILNEGRNYFYCQTKGQAHSDPSGRYYNTWFARTDDDTGNRNVYVSATAFSVGGDWEPIPGLPAC